MTNSPFLGRGIFGSGWQRQTCGERSPNPVETALAGVFTSVGLSLSIDSSALSSVSRDAFLFLVTRGDVGVGCSSSLVRRTGLALGVDLGIWILLLFLKLRLGLPSSVVGERKLSSPTCMFDLTYLLGTLKNVATGGGGGDEDRIGGNARLSNILQKTTSQLI
jgi:hypothetical protein